MEEPLNPQEQERNLPERKFKLLKQLTWAFVILFTCFSAGGSLIAAIYDKRHLKSYGQVNYFVTYISFFFSTLVCDNLMQKFNKSSLNLKKTMGCSALFYTFYKLINAFSCYCTTPTLEENYLPSYICRNESLLVLNVLGSFVMGFFGATLIWAAQYLYVNLLAKGEINNSGVFFAYFFGKLQYT